MLLREIKVDELIFKSISNDETTYKDEFEREFVLSIVKHFFNEYDWNNFDGFYVDTNTYNKYYRDLFLEYYPFLEKYHIQKLLRENRNESI
ncbi:MULTISPECIES: hypothetical protein [Arcobacteraceae]|jgi:hypothetical protein|uniref:hypothetical protein n=1 Tax=Arcobacteraceae TaxID=2808963 RepID=UPI0018DF40AB|nr:MULTISPECIES: hypothetical protein [Arcobacteraceae]MCT7541619.1 hypothetical protein [Aliarcobacter cryaerophilus]